MSRGSSEVPPEQRVRPAEDDGCPLFSTSLEDHLVAVSRGEEPARGRFCGHCYTPLARQFERCPHCRTSAATERAPVERVPDEIANILRRQRQLEARWVNGMAYLGLVIAVVAGIIVVLAIPFFRDRLIWATALYAVILLIGSRVLAGLLGYVGDGIGYQRARAATVAAWDAFVGERDSETVPPG